MAKYTFRHEAAPGSEQDGVVVQITYDDGGKDDITQTIDTFAQFLLGVSYTPETIKKFINSEVVQ